MTEPSVEERVQLICSFLSSSKATYLRIALLCQFPSSLTCLLRDNIRDNMAAETGMNGPKAVKYGQSKFK